MKVGDEHLWLDCRYIGTQYLQAAPHETWMGWLVDLLTLSVEYTLSLYSTRAIKTKCARS